MKDLYVKEYEAPLPPPPSTRRRRFLWAFAIGLVVVVVLSLGVLLISGQSEVDTSSAIQIDDVNATDKLKYKCMNHSHWLPESNLNKIHARISSGLANVDNPSSNKLVYPDENVTVLFRSRVLSLQECAIMARAYNRSFFSWESGRQVCYLSDPTSSMMLDIGINYNSSAECFRMCNRTLQCAAMTFVDGECTFYRPTINKRAIQSGWILPPKVHNSTNASATITPPRPFSKALSVHFYVTAHQDDHELFMAKQLYASFRDPFTKVAFIYTTAGDANRTDGWWQAREVGTLASSKFFVDDFGYYASDRKDESIKIQGRSVQRVTMGNFVSYFMRISETGLTILLRNQSNNNVVLPLGTTAATSAGYSSTLDVQSVIQEILRNESAGIATVGAYTLEYATNGNDHELHKGTGLIATNAINAESRLAKCTSKTYLFGYETWLTAVNMQDPELSTQRRMWIALAAAIEGVYSKKDVWSNHAINLGRNYISRANVTKASCSV
ncbi:unnamed protein product [Aphanomyces euteiches]